MFTLEISTKNSKYINKCNTGENKVNKQFRLKTVGYVLNPDRLVHRWVSEMMLNVQSNYFK